MKNGLIHVYCGDGKGKTTAAIGLAVRAAGRNFKVLFAQFLKGNKSGERVSLSKLENINLTKTPEHIKFYVDMNYHEKEHAKNNMEKIFSEAISLSNDYDLLILDEVLGLVECNFLDIDTLVDFLKNRPKNLEVVLTGRKLPDEIKELADYVTNFEKIKHPYDKGHLAREGIEF